MKWETIKLELSCIKDNEEIIGRSSEKCPQLFVFGGERLIIIPKVEDRIRKVDKCLQAEISAGKLLDPQLVMVSTILYLDADESTYV